MPEVPSLAYPATAMSCLPTTEMFATRFEALIAAACEKRWRQLWM